MSDYIFADLQSEYLKELAACVVNSSDAQALAQRCEQLLTLAQQHSSEWDEVEGKTGVPRLWGIASFEREASSDYSLSPAQGNPWNRVSTDEPKGLGPYSSWGSCCVAAYDYDDLQKVGKINWSWARACYEGEAYNGFGPRAHGRRTGYLWSWSSVYDGGKYTADGVWSSTTWDEQCGMVPMMLEMLKQQPSLALTNSPPASSTDWGLPSIIIPYVVHGPNTTELQTDLNKLGASPQLVVDGSYGRMTKRAIRAFQKAHSLEADGIAGPETWTAINTLLAASTAANPGE